MMKFYGLMINKTTHAEGVFMGTKNPDKKRCSLCRVPFDRSKPNLIPPIQFQFTPSSENIGDFIFCTGNPYPLISQRVRQFLEEHKIPIEFENVEFLKPGKKSKVPVFPVIEPYYLIRAKSFADIDFNKTEIPRTGLCRECGRDSLQWTNPGMNSLLSKKNIHMFVINPFWDGATYVTEDLLDKLKARGFSNLENLLLKGEIVFGA